MKKNNFKKFILLAIVILTAAYLCTGIYSLQSGQNALVLRFGKVVTEVTDPGIHYHLPFPFEKVLKVRVSEVKKVSLKGDLEDSLEVLTGDENLIQVDAIINYDIKNLSHYLFNSQKPEELIVSVGQMFLSRELGKMMVDNVLTIGKSMLRLVMKEKIQQVLDKLKTGVRVISVELIDISPPSPVSPSFKAVSDSREKKHEIIKEAEGYANSVIPRARGKAGSELIQAEAYAKETIDFANGAVNAFDLLLDEYRENPGITLQLRYLETMKKIFSKVQLNIDANPSNSIYYIYGGKDLKENRGQKK